MTIYLLLYTNPNNPYNNLIDFIGTYYECLERLKVSKENQNPGKYRIVCVNQDVPIKIGE